MLLLRELAITSLLLLGSAEAAFYSKNSAVIQLDSKNFKKEIIDSTNVAVVEFYAPWCGHCQNLKPAYSKLAESLQGIVKVAAIDCDDEKNKRTCGEHGVQGFPTLKIFKPSKTKGKPSVEDYNGERTAKAISDAILKRVPDHVTKLTSSTFDGFLEKKNETAKAILFTNKAKTSPLWKSMAIDFLGVISFGQVHEKEKEVVEKFRITKYPTIVFLPGGDAEGVVYEGQLKKAGLSEFFSKYETPKSDPWETEGSSSSSPSSSSTTTSSAAPKVTEKPKPEVPALSGISSLQTTCLEKKSKTCILAVIDAPVSGLTEVYGKLHSRPPPHTFQVFKVSSTDALAKELVEKLELGSSLPQVVAVNYRGWYRRFTGDLEKPVEVLAWLDAIKMGEGKKEKIPEALFAQEEEKVEEKAEEKIEEKKEEKTEEEKKEDIKDEL